jgi:hypothetical protein
VFSSPISRWAGGTAAVCLGLVAVTYVGLVGPKHGEADDLRASAEQAQTRDDTLEVKLAQLKTQFAKLPEKQSELATALGQMPVDADVPTVVRSLDTLATKSGVSLDAVTPAPGQYIDSSGHPAGSLTAGSGSKIVGIPMTVTVHGPYFKTVTFLKGLQSGQRAFLVTGLQVSVASADVTLTIKGRVFALPGAAAALDALTASATTGSAGSTSDGTTSPSPSSPSSAVPSSPAPSVPVTQ